MNPDISTMLPTFCDAVSSLTKSWRGQFWFIVSNLGWQVLLLLIATFLIWTAFELAFGGNSANGSSKEYNIAIGSTTFFILQSVIGLILSFLFGDGVYCLVWPLAFHLIPFWLTGAFWRWTGFWVY